MDVLICALGRAFRIRRNIARCERTLREASIVSMLPLACSSNLYLVAFTMSTIGRRLAVGREQSRLAADRFSFPSLADRWRQLAVGIRGVEVGQRL